MTPLETLAVLVFMGPLLLMGLSFIAYTVYSIIEKIVDRLGRSRDRSMGLMV